MFGVGGIGMVSTGYAMLIMATRPSDLLGDPDWTPAAIAMGVSALTTLVGLGFVLSSYDEVGIRVSAGVDARAPRLPGFANVFDRAADGLFAQGTLPGLTLRANL